MRDMIHQSNYNIQFI